MGISIYGHVYKLTVYFIFQEDHDWAAESLIPEEYHVVRVSGVHGLNVQDAQNTTLTKEHEHHVTLFPSLKPNSRKEVSL